MQNTNKHLSPEQIARCANAISSGTYAKLPEHLRKHLYKCDQCAHEVINVTEMSSDTEISNIIIEEIDETEKRKPLININRKTLISIAASIVILAAAMIFGIPGMFDNDNEQITLNNNVASDEDKSNQTTVQISKDTNRNVDTKNKIKPIEEDSSLKKKTNKINKDNIQKDDLLAINEPNPRLEKLYQNMQGTYRGESIEVKTPAELHFSKKKKLEWENNSEQSFIVEIFDNKGKEILVEKTTEEEYQLPELSPGLYYWKLIDEDFELLFVGKIFVQP